MITNSTEMYLTLTYAASPNMDYNMYMYVLLLVYVVSIIYYFYVLGTVVTNPNAADAPSISVQFKEYSQQPIIYPSMEKVLELASKEMTNVSTCTYTCTCT